ncbi:uncharacterized protein EI97DRAFT_95776 [Westerdykella ornata]|uniref:Uncharacterized protein n=1 Tax=Westerdykella ornata TaxID=318751 RepID=A0A6A6JF79_WESOR|nr:uncharacterized protein EI97DRAFT_95776 [Westerdykella ornata]KAF2274648.1 hypothetical protein EI97DRAFT_95776 [Westerdykella ornata]
MPTWLVHGFRWPRSLIRVHVILENLDDAAPGWLMAPRTTAALLENFRNLHPEQMRMLPSLQFIEQYDPNDWSTSEQPYAYVCDQVHEIKLSVDIDDVRGKGVSSGAWAALADLRDKVAAGEKIGWFIVVNGDVERGVPSSDPVTRPPSTAQSGAFGQHLSFTPGHGVPAVPDIPHGARRESSIDPTKRDQKGLRKWLSVKVRKSKRATEIRTVPLTPPLPNGRRNGSFSLPNRLIQAASENKEHRSRASVPSNVAN